VTEFDELGKKLFGFTYDHSTYVQAGSDVVTIDEDWFYEQIKSRYTSINSP